MLISTPRAVKAPRFRAFIEVIFDAATVVRSPAPMEYVADPTVLSVRPQTALLRYCSLVFFFGRARRSRDGLLESCTCRRRGSPLRPPLIPDPPSDPDMT